MVGSRERMKSLFEGYNGHERGLLLAPLALHPCCFSMIRTEGPEALVVKGEAVTICQHHLYMASSSSEAPAGRPRGGETVKVEGPARARAIELIENRRRQYAAHPPSPTHCRLRFSISCPGRAPAGPSRLIFYADGPRTVDGSIRLLVVRTIDGSI